MAKFKHKIKRGDTRTLTITATNPDGSNYSLSGKTVYFTAKRSIKDPDSSAVITKSTSSGINIMGSPNQHKAVVSINADDTEDMAKDTTLICDVEVIDGANVYTVADGTLTVERDVRQG